MHMQTRFPIRLAGISLSLLFVIGLPRQAAAIVVEDDVTVEHPNCTPNCPHARTGPPRFVGNPDQLTIFIDLSDNSPNPLGRNFLELIFYDENLTELCVDSDELHGNPCHGFLRLSDLPGGKISLTLRNFGITRSINPDWIITIKGTIAIGTLPPGQSLPSPVTVTISAGNAVIADRVGDLDFAPEGVLDVPPRSVELVRAMIQLQKPAMELDATSRDEMQVGWTHVFQSPGGNIKDAKITVQLSDQPPCRSNDFIRVDSHVIRLDDLQPEPDPCSLGRGTSSLLILDLMKANLTGELNDGPLNVIVSQERRDPSIGGVGNGVSYSILTITLKD
jgi:hypothetical protein